LEIFVQWCVVDMNNAFIKKIQKIKGKIKIWRIWAIFSTYTNDPTHPPKERKEEKTEQTAVSFSKEISQS
jgi:hypothetical protein